MSKQTTSRVLLAAFISVFSATTAFADIVISSGATSNVTCSSGVCTPTSSDAVLNVGDLETLLASGNVTLAAAGQPVDVDIESSLSWVSTNTLTLDSYHSINVEQPVAITGGGGLSIITNDGGSGGEFSFAPATNVDLWSLSSSLTINGAGYTLVGDIATLAADIAANPSGSYALAANYNSAPDGTYSASPVGTDFYGNFQGLGNTISNLTISNRVRGANLGLFSFAASSASISNIALQNAVVSGSASSSIVGSVIGYSEGTMFGDHASGAISGQASSIVGGLAGANFGTILNSSSSASTTSHSGSFVGGLTGYNFGGTISGCFASGRVSGTQSKLALGGLVGDDGSSTISNSYATGSVSESGDSDLGGMVGVFVNTAITSSYSTSALKDSKSQQDLGGFIGLYSTGTTSNDYWDTTTSDTGKASGNVTNLSGVTGDTTKQLKAGLPAGFDPTIWAQSKSINKGFPYLIANPPQ